MRKPSTMIYGHTSREGAPLLPGGWALSFSSTSCDPSSTLATEDRPEFRSLSLDRCQPDAACSKRILA